ncbi:glycosyltransferase [Rouxiella sp. Mn2063]|uniref:glycosyltransferase n=1 Tax=Rouxiella sp. Mn2063 TaxID=3395262 RepID=UPI003BBA6CA4
MKIIASLVLYRHEYQVVEKTLSSLILEDSISKIVIVDNGSHCDWLLDLNEPKIETIRLDKNNGFGFGHNTVFSKFKDQTDYFLICNPDVYFEKGEVEKLYLFSKKENLGLAIPKIIYPDGRLQHGCKLLPSPYHLFARRFLPRFSNALNKKYELHNADYSQAFSAPSLSGCFMLLSNQAINDVGYFDTRFFLYLEDVDLSRRIYSNYSVSYYPDVVITHEFQRRSYFDKRCLFYHIVSAIKYFNKWGWFVDKDRRLFNQRCLDRLP